MLLLAFIEAAVSVVGGLLVDAGVFIVVVVVVVMTADGKL